MTTELWFAVGLIAGIALYQAGKALLLALDRGMGAAMSEEEEDDAS